MDYYEKLEELARAQKREVGKLSSRLGFDGSPHMNFDDLVPKKREYKNRGRKKGTKNLTIRQRLLKRMEAE